MKKILFIILFGLLSSSFYAQEDTLNMPARKLSFNDFMAYYSINDTSAALIEFFFERKETNAVTEMTFLPLSAGIYFLSPTIGITLGVISVPLFLHGTFTLVRFNKKRLKRLLINYQKTGFLPKKMRKKAEKIIYYYSIPDDY